MVQSRNVYVTGDDNLDRILNDLSQRLDIIEGLRPDLDAGYYHLDNEKTIDTESLNPYQSIDSVTIGTESILVTSSDGNSVEITGKYIEIKDENGAIIHKIGSWT